MTPTSTDGDLVAGGIFDAIAAKSEEHSEGTCAGKHPDSYPVLLLATAPMWSHLGKFGIFAGGCVTGAAAATAARAYERRQAVLSGEYYECSGAFYQVLGHAWDHFRRDFCVVYRPLYHCEAKEGSFEAHVLATSHFERFDEKFRRVDFDAMSMDARSLALPGPFWHDKFWGLRPHVVPAEGGTAAVMLQSRFLPEVKSVHTGTTSGYGSRSHEERPTRRQLSSY
eukprot:s442_g4.t1